MSWRESPKENGKYFELKENMTYQNLCDVMLNVCITKQEWPNINDLDLQLKKLEKNWILKSGVSEKKVITNVRVEIQNGQII
jgi:hypothetical protein